LIELTVFFEAGSGAIVLLAVCGTGAMTVHKQGEMQSQCMQEQAAMLNVRPLELHTDGGGSAKKKSKDDGNNSKVVIIGCVAVLLVALVAMIIGGALLWRRKRHRPASMHVCTLAGQMPRLRTLENGLFEADSISELSLSVPIAFCANCLLLFLTCVTALLVAPAAVIVAGADLWRPKRYRAAYTCMCVIAKKRVFGFGVGIFIPLYTRIRVCVPLELLNA
jgi:hypothetical protein